MMKRVYKISLWRRLWIWLHRGRYFIGIDPGAMGGDMTCKMYGKFIGDVLHITRIEYEKALDPYLRMKEDQRKGFADYS